MLQLQLEHTTSPVTTAWARHGLAPGIPRGSHGVREKTPPLPGRVRTRRQRRGAHAPLARAPGAQPRVLAHAAHAGLSVPLPKLRASAARGERAGGGGRGAGAPEWGGASRRAVEEGGARGLRRRGARRWRRRHGG